MSVPPGTGPLSPGFTGIDPALMDTFITELEHARGLIGEHTEKIRRLLAANDLPATALAPLAGAGHWIDEQLPALSHRTRLARETAHLPVWSPGHSGLLPYQEATTLPPAQARRLGAGLAARYTKIDPSPLFDPELDEKYQKIVDALAAQVQDPVFTAAFFAGIGLQRTLRLPARLRHGLPQSARPAIDTISRAFGTAVSAGATTGAFAAIATALKDKARDRDEHLAVGDLLSAGRFPTEWLAQVTATQVFARGEDSTGPALTGYLQALAKDPGAARLAIGVATRDSALPKGVLDRLAIPLPAFSPSPDTRPDLVRFLKDLNDRAAVNAGSADAFGMFLAAASGAYDEEDGRHSDAAARFAFAVITAAGGFDLAGPTRSHLSEIAGTYVTELTAGADLSDTDHTLGSAFGDVGSRVLGEAPKFRLSPEDVYKFMRTFTDCLGNQLPFQAGMDRLATRLVGEGVSDMMKSRDFTRLDDMFAAFGNVRGLQLAAREEYGQRVDDAAEEYEKTRSFVIGTAMGLAGLISPIERIPRTWTALSTAWSGVDTYKPDGVKELDKIRAADERETMGRQHAIAQALMDSGFTPRVPPREYQAMYPQKIAIADADGRLRPFAEILKYGNDGLDALDRWFMENGLGSEKPESLGEMSDRFASTFEGRKVRAKSRAIQFDNER